jgi:type IV pilus assembly protein PilV
MKTSALAPMRRCPSSPSSRHVDGFTLLEVLVAIVVLSFGVLGVVGLQAAALKANKEARYQSAAVALGRELGDMMRGNKRVALDANASQNPYLVNFTGTLPSTTADCFNAGPCASDLAVAEFNMREWLARVQLVLPDARVVVCFDDFPYDSDGKPTWACTPAGGSAVTGGGVVVKIGWARQSTDTSKSTLDVVRGTGAAGLPSVVLPLISGSTT